jgi:hypothetical protein
MAQTTVVNLIPQTAHPGPSSTAVSLFGTKQQAAAYYLANRDLQTITWHFSGSFEGDCVIQVSLETDPGDTDWYTVYTINTSSELDGYHNLTGNFVWLRAVVTNWTQGFIQLVTASY